VLTQGELDRCVWQEAQRYLNAGYRELAELARDAERVSAEWRQCCGEEVSLDLLLGEGGTFRKRVTVELIMTAGEEHHSLTSIVYFEKFRSGKVYGPWARFKRATSAD
jgi:hypothetical protein